MSMMAFAAATVFCTVAFAPSTPFFVLFCALGLGRASKYSVLGARRVKAMGMTTHFQPASLAVSL
jgi:hypothetical protein